MRRITDWLRGYAVVMLTGGTPQWCLNRLTAARIPFWGMIMTDEFTVSICVYQRDVDFVREIASRAMCDLEVVSSYGLKRWFGRLRSRWALLIPAVIAVAAAITLQQSIWFYRVEGNVRVPSARILRAAQEAGAFVGVHGTHVKPQRIRYRVLAAIPELEWLTVTQNGCVGVIHVRERKPTPKITARETPRNLIAVRGGLIQEISVLEGSAAVKEGDTVGTGELLISGYVDLENKYRVCRAEGEVYAKTWRTVRTVTPDATTEKTGLGRIRHRYYLQVGRNRVNLSLGSGIFTGTCDKMTETKQLTLPGGLSLPVALIVETVREYTPQRKTVSQQHASEMMRHTAESGIREEMIAGKIVRTEATEETSDGIYTLLVQVECEEMIARPIRAEIFKGD